MASVDSRLDYLFKIQVVAIVQVPVLYVQDVHVHSRSSSTPIWIKFEIISFIQGGSMLFSFKTKFVYASIPHATPLHSPCS